MPRQYLFKRVNEEDKVYEEHNVLYFQVKTIFEKNLSKDLVSNVLRYCDKCKSVLILNFCSICDKTSRSRLPSYLLHEYEIDERTPAVVFIIDISASMDGEKLINVKNACLRTLDEFSEKCGKAKVALITFNDSTQYYGDRGTIIETIKSPFDINTKIKREKVYLREINSSYFFIERVIRNLSANHGTNINGALYKAVSIASDIILCTDGMAQDENIDFNDRIVEFAKFNKIRINVFTFQKNERRFSVLERLTRGTNGIIKIISKEVCLETCLNKILNSVANSFNSSKCSLIYDKSEIRFDSISNHVTEAFEISEEDNSKTWYYGIQVQDPLLKEVVFQLKIYTMNKLRVLTEKRELKLSKNNFIGHNMVRDKNLFENYLFNKLTDKKSVRPKFISDIQNKVTFHPRYVFKSSEEKDTCFEECNLLCFQLKNIFEQNPSSYFQPAIFKTCQKCNSVLIYDKCSICDKNFRSILPNYLLFEYDINFEKNDVEQKVPIIAFVIDVSGSMKGTRLNDVKIACKKTLEKLKRENGDAKVALITFSTFTKYYGDKDNCSDISNFNKNVIERESVSLSEFSSSYKIISRTIENLQSEESTNICPALHKAVSIATEIVLCTDGLAQDEDLNFYRKIIEFAKMNNIKINVITFNDSESKVSVLGKFSRETKGFLSRTTDAVDLEACLSKLLKSVANFSGSSKFCLIFDKYELDFESVPITISNSNAYEVYVKDICEKWIYKIKVLDPSLKEIVLQIKFFHLNKLRVLILKREVTKSRNLFLEEKENLFESVLHANIGFSVTDNIINSDEHMGQIINKAKDLYSQLGYGTTEMLTNFFGQIDALNKFSELNDASAYLIYDLFDSLKEKITCSNFASDPECILKIEKFNILMIKFQHEKLSSLIRQKLFNKFNLKKSSEALSVSNHLTWTIDKIRNSSFDRSKLFLLNELLKVVQFFLPGLGIKKFESNFSSNKKHSSKQSGFSNEERHINEIYSVLNVLIPQEYEKSKIIYVIEMNSLIKLMKNFIVKLVHIEKRVSLNNSNL